MKIGIYGGSFNPVHIGHLTVAEEAKKRLGLDKLIFVPAGNPYFKDQKEIESFGARECMILDAIHGMDGFEVSAYESATYKPSYTSETLQHYHEVYPKAELFLIVGEDAYYQMHKWHDVDTIISLATIVCFTRNQAVLDSIGDGSIQSFIDWKKTDQGKRVNLVQLRSEIALSSSYVRKQIRDGGSFRFLVPHSAYKRIANNKLYGYGGDDFVIY